MRITFLGTGTSHGIPVIACNCRVCTSNDPKNTRSRASVLIEDNERSILIDTSTDFRRQALRESLHSLDAILLTHAHADHLNGLDDIRSLCRREPLPVYGDLDTLNEVRERYKYIFSPRQRGGGIPNIVLNNLDGSPLSLPGLGYPFVPVPLKHGIINVTGYRFANVAYLTDCNYIPPASFDLLKGIEVLIIDALRYTTSSTHFSISEAIDQAEKLEAKKTYFTHICHEVDHSEGNAKLPENIELAYDGLRLEL